MKKRFAAILILCLMLALPVAACAEQPERSAVYELYSAEGYYEDSLGNLENYSYHVPQFFSYAPGAEEINREIEERFGTRVEAQYRNMEEGYSLWMWHTEWHAYWHGSQLFLLITSDEEGGFTDCAAYGYDFETDSRVTNERILEQMGISEEEYLENLKEKVQLMFEDMYRSVPEETRERVGYDEMLEKTLDWLDMDQPMYLDGFGSIVTIVKIASIAGAEWYYHFATPFSYG